jgi:hypothetical protein
LKLSALKTDPRIDQGAWVREIPGLPGLAFKVRPLNNNDAQRIYRRALAQIPRANRVTGVDPADERAASDEALLKAVLLDWSGLEDDEAGEIPYSEKLAREIITQPEYDAFREGLIFAATVVKEIGVLDLKEAAKN